MNHPRHYTSHASGIECIDIARHMSGDWFNAFKYVFRADHKNGRQDIEKAIFYAKDAIAWNMPVRGFGWTQDTTDKLDKVISFETGWRMAFFIAVQIGESDKALAAIEQILEDWLA